MLTHLHIKNFKAWKDTGPIRLAPLTVLFGANSAGKSSLGHLLLALQQTTHTDRKRALHLGDTSSLIDLGTFTDCLHGHDLTQSLSFELGWTLPKAMDVRDPLQTEARYQAITCDWMWHSPPTRHSNRKFRRCDMAYLQVKEVLDVVLERDEKRKLHLTSELYGFKMADGRKWPLEEPEKFYRLSDTSMARYKNAGFLADFALAHRKHAGAYLYLGPLRSHPQRIYQWSGDTPASVGQMGEYTIAAILAAQGESRRLNQQVGHHTGFCRVHCCVAQRLGCHSRLCGAPRGRRA